MRAPKWETKTGLKKGLWSLEEDQMLISYINKYGIWNWSHMPKFAGLSRSGKSCRLRWMNYLKPDLKKGSFSKEEERSILHFHSILGNRWSAIASKLPGRSDNEIKNYWHTHLKKLATNSSTPKKPDQKDMNFSSRSEAHNVEEIQEPANHVNNITDSFSWTSDDDSSTTSSIIISKVQEVDFEADYYDINSPGTVEDLQCFWKQLCPENLELGNNDQEIVYDQVFQDSNEDKEMKFSWHTHVKKRATNNPMPKKPDRKAMNLLSKSEAHNVEKIQEPANHVNNITDSLYSWTTNDDSSTTSSIIISTSQEVQMEADYHDINSPGTVEDLECFWKQLCPFENLELQNMDKEVFYDHVFHHDPVNPYDNNYTTRSSI